MRVNRAIKISLMVLLVLLLIGIEKSLAVENRGVFVWSKDYRACLGKDHIFPMVKYQGLYHMAIRKGILQEEDVVEPHLMTDDDLLLVHTRSYFWELRLLSLTRLGMLHGENPVSRQILEAARLAAGGTYKASLLALEHGLSMNLGGGFHHAFTDRKAGFHYYNDVAIAIRKLQGEGKAANIMVIDCDVHHGNGTAKIFLDDKSVFVFDIYQEDNFPLAKIDVDYAIGLNSFDEIDDKRYLKELEVLPDLIDKFKPELIIYLAGADPYKNDLLGGFKLTKEGLKKRDEYVIGLAVKNRIPICILLAGGHTQNLEDLIEIHLNTIRVVKDRIAK